MKRLFKSYLAFLLLGSLLATTACKKEGDPEPDEEQELITTVVLRLEPEVTGKGQSETVTWRDLDGPGGQDPLAGTLTLHPNTTYKGTLTFLDESRAGQPSEDITEEIKEKGEEHEVFYVVTPADLVTFQKTDRDNRNRPIGIETTVTTGEVTATGKVRIVLKHQPNLKSASSNINTGETDVDIEFDVVIRD